MPPTIPRNYLNKFPTINTMISQIEESGNYKLIIKDCSLDKGYPVVCAIYLNKNNQSYFIKLGSHPIFEIAVERTLTELLQGQDINNMKGAKEYSYRSEIYNEYDNLMGILVNGSGYYPPEIFSSKFSYEFKEFTTIKPSNNKEMLSYMINILENEGYTVFIRDVSILGFPSFHVIVPTFSEIDAFDDTNSIDNYSKYNKIKPYIRNLKDISNDNIEEIIQYFNDMDYNIEASIPQFLNLSIKNIFPWYYSKIDLFLTALYYKKENYIKAYETLNQLIKKLNTNLYNQMEYIYYNGARDYIGTKIDGLTEDKAMEYLNKFYSIPVIRGIITDFGDTHRILINYGEFECCNCNKCKFNNRCLYKEEERIYKALKDKYIEIH